MRQILVCIVSLFVVSTSATTNQLANISKNSPQSIAPIISQSIKAIVNLTVQGEIPIVISDSDDKIASPDLTR